MKKKDIVTLVIAVVILLGAGYVAYTQLLAPKSAAGSAGTEVEVIGLIPSRLDQSGLDTLADSTKVVDFTPQLDLTKGLGTTTPFGK